MAFNPARYIARRSRRLGLDPRAVLSVARTEGGLYDRPGTQDIGDLSGGGSYGPFQLYTQGALPGNIGRLPMQQRDDWAWSKKGLNYALQQIAGVSKGMRGGQAIENIVRRFERPADPDSQIAKAMAYYRAGGKVPSSPSFSRSGRFNQAVGGVPRRKDLLQFVFQNNQSFITTGRVDPVATLNLARAMRRMQDYGLDGGQAQPLDQGVKVSSKGWSGGRSAIIDAMRKAKGMGLSVRENPAYDPVDPVHVEGSYHYQRYPGNIGRAADISGSSSAEAAFVNWARKRYGNKIAELFYDPMGGWKHGQSIGPIGGHQHVHIAF